MLYGAILNFYIIHFQPVTCPEKPNINMARLFTSWFFSIVQDSDGALIIL